MLKHLFFGLLLTVTATPAMAQLTASEFAAKLKPAEGKPLGDTDIKIVTVRAEGTLAILTLDSPDWGTERGTVTDVFAGTFCADGENPDFFARMQLRIDTLEKGEGLVTGRVVDKCPPADAEQ